MSSVILTKFIRIRAKTKDLKEKMQLKLQIGLRQDLVAGGGALLGRGRGREKGGREGDLKRSVRSRAVDAGNLPNQSFKTIM